MATPQKLDASLKCARWLPVDASDLPIRWEKKGPTTAVTPNVMKLMTPTALPLALSGLTSLMMVYGIIAAPEAIRARMNEVQNHRETAQPIREKTGGSTFKNPPGHSAWKLIDAAGCRGLRVGGAQVSEMHCNFLINTGTATGHDIETLGETVRERVKQNSGIELHWEIKRIGIEPG